MDYKIYIMEVPEQLKKKIKVYSVDYSLKIRDVLNDAVRNYLEKLKDDNQKLIDEDIYNEYPGEWVSWSIQIDKELYKQAKTLSVNTDKRIYDIIVTAFRRYLATKR